MTISSRVALRPLREPRPKLVCVDEVARLDRRLALTDSLQGRGITEDLERFLEPLEILDADQHRRRPSVLRDRDPFVLTLDAIDELRELILHVPKRLRGHGHDCATQAGPLPLMPGLWRRVTVSYLPPGELFPPSNPLRPSRPQCHSVAP